MRSCYSSGSRVELLLRSGCVQGLHTFILSQAVSYSSLVPQIWPGGFSAASPLCLHPFPSQTSSCLYLSFGTQGRS